MVCLELICYGNRRPRFAFFRSSHYWNTWAQSTWKESAGSSSEAKAGRALVRWTPLGCEAFVPSAAPRVWHSFSSNGVVYGNLKREGRLTVGHTASFQSERNSCRRR